MYLARLTPMVISGSQHPLKVDYSILKYIVHLWVNKILVVVVVVSRSVMRAPSPQCNIKHE